MLSKATSSAVKSVAFIFITAKLVKVLGRTKQVNLFFYRDGHERAGSGHWAGRDGQYEGGD